MDETDKKSLPPALEKNLWQPGQSGNPAGRPKGSPNLKTIIRRLLDATHPTIKKNPITGEESVTVMEAIVLGQMKKAIEKQDTGSASWLAERGFGKEADLIGGDPDNPLNVSHTIGDILRSISGKTTGLPVPPPKKEPDDGTGTV